ncbi:MAG TPA: SAM-dependent methyltransferase, partial [Pseudohongiella sp.]|nr:SAM-dependent methyltransferase [Pseudohongiella sp.]
MKESHETRIIDSWRKNATPWARAVQAQTIASRRLVTNDAVISAVLDCRPTSVLDTGCGEGWLTRQLSPLVGSVTGIDVIPELIAEARRHSAHRFEVMTYDDLASGALKLTVDLMVCNFSLLGKESGNAVVDATQTLLPPGGHLVIQTLHPLMACGDAAYQDGWREGSWLGFNDTFTDPAPWYFRTLESWVALVNI